MTLFDYFKEHFRIISCDSEFQPVAGEMPRVLCFVFKDIVSKQVWRCESKEDVEQLPFDWSRTMLVAFNNTAESKALLAWDIPLPEYWVDCWVEAKVLYNTGSNPSGFFTQLNVAKLLNVPLQYVMSNDEKGTMRDLILDHDSWSRAETVSIIDYCEEDVVCLEHIFPRICDAMENKFSDRKIEHLAQHMLVRGLAKAIEGEIYRNGVPVDYVKYKNFLEKWPDKKAEFIEDKNKTLGVFENGIFKQDLFEKLLIQEDLFENWPKTKTNKCSQADKVLEDYELLNPKIKLLRAVRKLAASDRLSGFAVGKDQRSRGDQKFYWTKTGRAGPSNKDYPFVAPKWLRTFIGPPKGKFLAYMDFSHQEPCIQAALSGDTNLKAAVKEDVYMYTANQTGATKGVNDSKIKKAIRKIYKLAFLAIGYGMGDKGVGKQIQQSITKAREVVADIKNLYSTYFKWIKNTVEMFKIRGQMTTKHGWCISCKGVQNLNERSLGNWPIQSHGAEILYWTVINVRAAGFKIVATVHDAILVEFDISPNIILDVYKVRLIMERCAKEMVGMEIGVDYEPILYNWIQEEEEAELFNEIMKLVG